MMTGTDILALEQRRFKAMIDGNAAELDTLLHRDLNYTHSSGAVDTKDSYVRGIREKLWDYKTIKTSNEAVKLYGDTALVHCRLQIDLLVKDTPRQVDSLALSVWVKDGGHWQCVAVHSVPHPKG